MTAKVGIVLLAAGSSSRMNGGDKTLELIDGMTLLERLVQECIASSAFQTTLILPPDRPDRVAAIKHLEVQTVIAEDAQLGMSASIKAGIKALHGVEAALIVLDTVHKVMLNGHAATTDLDTPEAWQEWRASKRLS